ncbi:MAG: hypoxanthine phosphoribosyltransferase [Blastocatellia bacterium]
MEQSPAIITEFRNPNIEVLIPATDLQARIREIGGEIARDYAGRKPRLICVLKGAVMFLSDLIRAIDLELTIDFIGVSSYGAEKQTSGEVRITRDFDEPLADQHVILVEDILDTGLTLSYLLRLFESRGAASVAVATLLNKPARRRAQVEATYKGFDIPDEFVVGYGLDYAERYRNLPYIGVVKNP